MQFKLYRNPTNKAQKIPYPAMQISGLAEAEELVFHAAEGCILLARDSLSTREVVKTIALLDRAVASLVEQLAEKSREISARQDGFDDPLDMFDEDERETLEDLGIDLDGLRMLLAMEALDDA